jgi:hypothetical protein
MSHTKFTKRFPAYKHPFITENAIEAYPQQQQVGLSSTLFKTDLLMHFISKASETDSSLTSPTTKSRDSAIGTGTDNGLDGLGWIPGRARLFLFSAAPTPALEPIQQTIQWTRLGVSPG